MPNNSYSEYVPLTAFCYENNFMIFEIATGDSQLIFFQTWCVLSNNLCT